MARGLTPSTVVSPIAAEGPQACAVVSCAVRARWHVFSRELGHVLHLCNRHAEPFLHDQEGASPPPG